MDVYNKNFIAELRNKTVIVFGTGELSDKISKLDIEVEYYVDNNKGKWGFTFNHKAIKSPDTLRYRNKESTVVIVASMYYNEIAPQLIEYGYMEYENFFDSQFIYSAWFQRYLKNIDKFKNIHKGKRAFIIGNGPSLSVADLERIQAEVSFASNKIYKVFDRTSWRPTYYTVEDSLVIKNNYNDITANVKCQAFCAIDFYFELKNMENMQWLIRKVNNDDKNNPVVNSFSADLDLGFYSGFTVTYLNLQLAYYMGFHEIYLLGIDHNYSYLPNRTDSGQETFVSDESHNGLYFIQGYNKVGEQNYLPSLDLQYQAYCRAARFFKDNGVKVYNLSRSTKLDVFPLLDFDLLFG
jgi:hypothetical protein